MAVGDRYQLIDRQTILGQAAYNVYWFKQLTGPSGAAPDVIRLFTLLWLPTIINAQSSAVTHDLLIAINIDNVDDFSTLGLTDDNQGLETGDCLPPYACYAFRLNRASRAVRNGQKRLPGVAEANQADGVVVSGFLGSLTAIADLYEATLDNSDGVSFEHRIFHRAVGTPTPPLSDGTDYAISSAQYVRISTQNTRKFGRGA